MKVLAFAGALRTQSYNKKLAREALRMAQEFGHEVEFLDLRTHPLPPYDADIQEAIGIPDGVTKLAEKIRSADALILSTPEYNGSIPGVLKNVIDWLSREKDNPVCLTGQHLLLLAASPGALGGVRSLWHTRVPLEALGVYVFPQMLGISQANEAFDDAGLLKEESRQTQLRKLLESFLLHVQKFKIGALV